MVPVFARSSIGISAICGAAILLAGIALYVVAHQSTSAEMREMAERHNVALTKAFANAIWPRYRPFLLRAAEIKPSSLREHPVTAGLRAEVASHMRGLGVIKVKVYNLSGITVFSTDAAQIGDDKSANPGFISASTGHVASELTRSGAVSLFEQETEQRGVLASYVPIVGVSGNVEGVFEIYQDLMELDAAISRSEARHVRIVGGAFMMLFILIVAIVLYHKRMLVRQHSRNAKLAAEAKSAQELSRMKSTFLAHMSHQIRTPLNAILGYSDIMRKEMFGEIGSARYHAYLQDIQDSGTLLLNIMDDVLDVSKIEAGQISLDEGETDIRDLFSGCVRMVDPMARDQNIEIRTIPLGTTAKLYCDEKRVNQAILNLLSNAIKYSGDGERIDLSAGLDADGGFAIAISDRGRGISEINLPIVTQPFGQQKDPITGQTANPYIGTDQGIGLGLTIAKSLVELHGGELRIDSREGVGTTVTAVFPPERTIHGGAARPRGLAVLQMSPADGSKRVAG